MRRVFFFQAEDGIRDIGVTGVQTCALPILWDFPDGTLAGREVASHLVSEVGGWHVVPPTLLRDGPFGPGMIQVWVDTDDERELVDVLPPADVPPGWLGVLRARDGRGEPAVLVHADVPELRAMAT